MTTASYVKTRRRERYKKEYENYLLGLSQYLRDMGNFDAGEIWVFEVEEYMRLFYQDWIDYCLKEGFTVQAQEDRKTIHIYDPEWEGPGV